MQSATKARVAAPVLLLCLGFICWGGASAEGNPSEEIQQQQHGAGHQGLTRILGYISHGWDSLTRSMGSCETFKDVKSTGWPVLYLPADFSAPPEIENLENGCHVVVKRLPASIRSPGTIDVNSIQPQGLLYLPNPYVVPGGRFNEMYGWDSYFIIRGLLQAGKPKLARGIVENFFYEIEHYGAVLNANRTYYLTRSQPPFLTSMILAVYDGEKAAGNDDLSWLREAYPLAVRDHDYWTREPHLAGATGLSRYFDLGDGPAPEVLAGTPQYYRYVAAYFVRHPKVGDAFLLRSGSAKDAGLTTAFYKGDRSMRESGFDISFRFGPFGANTPDYAPVCLNSLLYKTEKDLGRISLLLGQERQAREWEKRAALRRQEMDKYLWNANRGLYFDYNFAKGTRSTYEFVTTFYPLWAGAASLEQAKAVAANIGIFLEPGGLVTSRRETKAQWDYPYGWAPLQLIAAQGLRRYGFDGDANRIAFRFLGTVLQGFERDGTIREKYNVVNRSSQTRIEAGYSQNVIGFGWTNGVFLTLLHNLPEPLQTRLANSRATPTAGHHMSRQAYGHYSPG